MKPLAAIALTAALLRVHVASAESVTLTCHVDFSFQQSGKPEYKGKTHLTVTVRGAEAANGYRRVIAADPDSSASFDVFEANAYGIVTSRGTFTDLSTSGSWTLNRSLRTPQSEEFEEVVINRSTGELFYQKQITDKLGTIRYTRRAFGPCLQVRPQSGSSATEMASLE